MPSSNPDRCAQQPSDNLPSRSNGDYRPGVVRGLLMRFRFANLAERNESRWLIGLFSFINGCLSIAIMATVALVSGQPFIFPSLGPTAFLFFYTPLAPPASPRNTIIGHLIGALSGMGSLIIFGLQDVGPALTTGVTAERVGAAALSLGLTSGLMVVAKSPHPPAGATTLIISLGILRTTEQIVVLMIAVVLLTGQALIINRLAGLPYPLWSAPASPPAKR